MDFGSPSSLRMCEQCLMFTCMAGREGDHGATESQARKRATPFQAL